MRVASTRKRTVVEELADTDILYDRHGEVQGVFLELSGGEVVASFAEDHNRLVSLETLTRWAEEGQALLLRRKKEVAAAAKKKATAGARKKAAAVSAGTAKKKGTKK